MLRTVGVQLTRLTFHRGSPICLFATDANADANAARQQHEQRANRYHDNPLGCHAEDVLVDGR